MGLPLQGSWQSPLLKLGLRQACCIVQGFPLGGRGRDGGLCVHGTKEPCSSNMWTPEHECEPSL